MLLGVTELSTFGQSADQRVTDTPKLEPAAAGTLGNVWACVRDQEFQCLRCPGNTLPRHTETYATLATQGQC